MTGGARAAAPAALAESGNHVEQRKAMSEVQHGTTNDTAGPDAMGPSLPDAGAWRRFFARLFDMWWQIPLVAFVSTAALGLVSPAFLAWAQSPRGAQVFAVACLPLSFLLDAFLVARFGRSPGKALLGLEVVSPGGARLTFGASVRRNLGMWFAGLALTIPLLNLATMLRQGWRVENGRPASYDEGRYRVLARPIGWGRKLGFAAAFAVLFVLLGLLANLNARHAPARPAVATGAATTWTNPETGHTTAVAPVWTHRIRIDQTGQQIHQFAMADGRAAVFVMARPAQGATLEGHAGTVIQAMADDAALPEGRFEDYRGLPSWSASATRDDKTATRVDVRVVLRGSTFWRVVAIQQRPYPASDGVVGQLRQDVWATIVVP